MVADQKERTISYRRAEWINGHPASINLGMCVQQSCERLRDVSARTLVRGDGQHMKLASYKKDPDGGHFLHVTTETPGEAATVVPLVADGTDEVNVDTIDPSDDFEFMDGDAFVYINKNHVCICGSGLREGAIRYFLVGLFEKAHIRNDSSQFVLFKSADINKLRLIEAEGIKEIELRTGLYAASMKYFRRKSKTRSFMSEVIGTFGKLFKSINDTDSESLRVVVTLKSDERKHGSILLAEKHLHTVAKDILENQEDGDDFLIITKKNQRIGPHELNIRSVVLIDRIGKSVERDKAWEELTLFYKNLYSSGALEQ